MSKRRQPRRPYAGLRMTDQQLLASAAAEATKAEHDRHRLPRRAYDSIVDHTDPCPICFEPIRDLDHVSTVIAHGQTSRLHWHCATTPNLQRLGVL